MIENEQSCHAVHVFVGYGKYKLPACYVVPDQCIAVVVVMFVHHLSSLFTGVVCCHACTILLRYFVWPGPSEEGGLEDDIFGVGEESGREAEKRPATRDAPPRHRDRCDPALSR